MIPGLAKKCFTEEMTSQLGLEEYIRFSREEGALKEKEQHTEQGSFTKGG